VRYASSRTSHLRMFELTAICDLKEGNSQARKLTTDR
jgi:hypothetical protein